MKPMVRLHFDGLPQFESSPLFCTLDPSTETALKYLPYSYERAVAALRFRQCIGGGGGALGVSEDHVHIMQVAYLRAALMEFVAIEEVLPLDLQVRNLGEKPISIVETGNAMLIILRELRHLQLHLVNTSFESFRRSAVLRTIDSEKEMETQLTVLTIPLADLNKLKSLRNAARFDPDELDAAISWFSHAQAQWGIGDVVQKAIQIYTNVIVQRYGLLTD